MESVLQRLANDEIGSGEAAKELVGRIGKYLNKKSGLAVRSTRTALHAAFTYLGLDSGSRIGFSVLSPISNRDAIVSEGYVPVPLDTAPGSPFLESPLNVDYGKWNLDCILVDTRFGLMADVATMKETGIPVVEIVSEGLGGFLDESVIGSIADIVIVGLEPHHILTAGGGAVFLANNRKRVRDLAQLSDFRDESLPDMNAALGLVQMQQLPIFIEKRRDLAKSYFQTVQRTSNSAVTQLGDGEAVYQVFPVKITASPVDVQKYARSHGVETAMPAEGSILESMRTDETVDKDKAMNSYSNAVSIAGNTVLFPLYPAMRRDEQSTIQRVLATLP